MTDKVVSLLVDLTEHLACAEKILFELRKYGIGVELKLDRDIIQIFDVENLYKVGH